jgi:hypothetical protein
LDEVQTDVKMIGIKGWRREAQGRSEWTDIFMKAEVKLVEEDLKRMRITGWRERAEDREEWSKIVEQTKTHPGL